MPKFESLILELLAPEPSTLADFYVRVFGFSVIENADARVLLEFGTIRLSIKRGDPTENESSVSWGLSAADLVQADEMAREALAAGAVVLTESKRDQSVRVGLQDPAGNEFFLVVTTQNSTAQLEQGLVVADKTTTSSSVGAPSPVKKPSPRMIDQLMDTARLASMQEAIAGLHRAFTPDDPANVLDEMRSKIGASSTSHHEEDPAIARIEAEQRAKAADDLLAQYKSHVLGTDSGVPTATVKPPANSDQRSSTPVPDDDPAVNETRPVPRTLGRAPDEDE